MGGLKVLLVFLPLFIISLTATVVTADNTDSLVKKNVSRNSTVSEKSLDDYLAPNQSGLVEKTSSKPLSNDHQEASSALSTESSSQEEEDDPILTAVPKAEEDVSTEVQSRRVKAFRKIGEYDAYQIPNASPAENSISSLILPEESDESLDETAKILDATRRDESMLDKRSRSIFKRGLRAPEGPYGPCYVSYGFRFNQDCLPNEQCVDRVTLVEVPCELGPGKACDKCAPPPVSGPSSGPPPVTGPVPGQPSVPGRRRRRDDKIAATASPTQPSSKPPQPSSSTPPPCPRGCKPGEGCPPLSGPKDGVCQDIHNEEDYDDTFTTPDPITAVSHYDGKLGKGEKCDVYGDLINEIAKSTMDYSEKKQKFVELAGNMCNWRRARLECISDEPRKPPAPPADPSNPEKDDDKRVPGTCQCMNELGENPVVIEDSKGRKICYIPANRGRDSDCDHEILVPPYGQYEGVDQKNRPFLKKFVPGHRFCVPDSECRSGYKYGGLRCMCRPKTQFDPKEFTCSGSTRLEMDILGNKLVMLIGIIFFFT